MILLLGGTSETASLTAALLRAGRDVLVSTATDVPLELPPGAQRRIGRLDEDAMARLVRDAGVRTIVDATHPYAQAAHEVALHVAGRTGIACIRWVRPATDIADEPGVRVAASHAEAARMACEAGRTILLTVGSQNLAPYVSAAASHGCRLIARVLPAPESLEACRRAGLADADVIAARGPFALEENRAAIRQFGVDVLVTKDSGAAGGLPEKLAAAKREDCQVILIRRPREVNGNQVHSIAELLDRVGPGA